MSSKELRLCDQERSDDDDIQVVGEVGAAAADADQPTTRPNASAAAAAAGHPVDEEEANVAAQKLEEELAAMPRGDDGFLAPATGARRKIGRRPPVDDEAQPTSDDD